MKTKEIKISNLSCPICNTHISPVTLESLVCEHCGESLKLGNVLKLKGKKRD